MYVLTKDYHEKMGDEGGELRLRDLSRLGDQIPKSGNGSVLTMGQLVGQ